MSRITDLSAAVVVLRPALRRARLPRSAAPGPAGCGARRGAPASPRTVPPATGRGDAEMTVSIPLLALMAIVVYVAYRHMGLRAWHAIVCLILGFLLASTSAAPQIRSVLAGIVHQAQAWLSGGKG